MFVPSANIVQEEYKAIDTPFTKTLAFFLFLIKFFYFPQKYYIASGSLSAQLSFFV